jgi:hypothetical protein
MILTTIFPMYIVCSGSDNVQNRQLVKRNKDFDLRDCSTCVERLLRSLFTPGQSFVFPHTRIRAFS